MKRYFCCEERRAEAVRDRDGLNGIAFLEVRDSPDLPDFERQRTLYVHFLNPLAAALGKNQVRIEGAPRSPAVKVVDAALAAILPARPAELSDAVDLNAVLVVTVDRPGDFSPYTLKLVVNEKNPALPAGFDPQLAAVDFSFKVMCLSDLDCHQQRNCPPEVFPEPALNYLAKDYASFRTLMLDRLALLLPGWKEQTPADIGVALVELLAYVGDSLSYRQDAVATEAYLETAQLRTSVRRHARLVDYPMHEGCGARVWVQIQASSDGVAVPQGKTQLLTLVPGLDARVPPDSAAYQEALRKRPEIFETMLPARLYQDHNQLRFYTWGARRCCLPKGAIHATLYGDHPHLKAGDVLIFMEVIGPRSGAAQDADPAHRHAVRLTHVAPAEDPIGGQFLTEPNPYPLKVTEIEWSPADRLPFPFCISSETDDGRYIEDISIALGNIVLADHGQTLPKKTAAVPEWIVPGPDPALIRPQPAAADPCKKQEPEKPNIRFRTHLAESPLTWAVPLMQQPSLHLPYDAGKAAELDAAVSSYPAKLPAFLDQQLGRLGMVNQTSQLSIHGGDGEWSLSDGTWSCSIREELDEEEKCSYFNVYPVLPAAIETCHLSASDALPAVTLDELEQDKQSSGEWRKVHEWRPVRDLFNSDEAAREFVVEMESDGIAWLRFGDDQFGMCPNSDTGFVPEYRVGNGSRGNIGAETIRHIVMDDPVVVKVWNPLPAQGGADPEDLEVVRQTAPYAFRRQERAVTPEDYAEIAKRHPEVQSAVATWRWTGSWHTIFLTIDRAGGLAVDGGFEQKLRDFIEPYRLAGHDLEIDGPVYVPLEIELRAAVRPGFPRGEVLVELMQRLGSGVLPDGQLGLFHPNNWTFGQTVYLSQVYAEAAKVDGLDWTEAMVFGRQDNPAKSGLDQRKLVLKRLEIVQLENDPNFPDHGVLRIKMEGGR